MPKRWTNESELNTPGVHPDGHSQEDIVWPDVPLAKPSLETNKVHYDLEFYRKSRRSRRIGQKVIEETSRRAG